MTPRPPLWPVFRQRFAPRPSSDHLLLFPLLPTSGRTLGVPPRSFSFLVGVQNVLLGGCGCCACFCVPEGVCPRLPRSVHPCWWLSAIRMLSPQTSAVVCLCFLLKTRIFTCLSAVSSSLQDRWGLLCNEERRYLEQVFPFHKCLLIPCSKQSIERSLRK